VDTPDAVPSTAAGPIRRIPGLTKAGAATIAFGLVFDLSEHSFATAQSTGFSLGEHAAHLVVLVGMILGLVGIIADGVRHPGRVDRPEGSEPRAIR
jgi:hypothetical protein